MGLTLSRQGKREEAIEEYRLALKIKPDLAEAHRGLGFLLKDQGKSTEAIEEFHLALKIKPEMAETHRGLGLVLSHRGNLAEALEGLPRRSRSIPAPPTPTAA